MATDGNALMKVGVRELRNNLSRYLVKVHAGDEIVVTDHGRAVAKVIPIRISESPSSAIDRLIAEGLASPAKKDHRSLGGELILAAEPVSPLVADQRR